MTVPWKSIAVALAYAHPGVPRVVAKGEGALAERIVSVAREHGVPIDENPALAAALATVELDREIPVELYRAVAIVIGAVLRAGGKKVPGKTSNDLASSSFPAKEGLEGAPRGVENGKGRTR